MEAVGIPPAGEEPPRELVDDLHLPVVGHDVFVVLGIQGIGPQELRYRVDPVTPFGIKKVDLVFPSEQIVLRERRVAFEDAMFRPEIGEDEEVPVSDDGGQVFAPLFGEVDLVVLLVDCVVELVVDFVHPAALVAHVFVFRLLDELFVRRIRHELHQLRVLREPVERPEQENAGLLFFPVSDELLGVCNDFRDEIPLGGNNPLNGGFHLVEFVVFALGGTADDQWSPGFVDEDGIHLVDDRIVVLPLNQVGLVHNHVVAEVIEAEFVVRTVGDVAGVFFPPLERVHGVLDAPDGQAEILVHLPHPDAVTLCQVIVDRDEVDPTAGKRVKVYRHCRHERFPFTSGHLGNLPLMEHHAADELDVEGDHVPLADIPEKIERGPDQPPAGVFDRCERLRKKLLEHLGSDLIPFLLQSCNFIHEPFPHGRVRVFLQFRALCCKRLIRLLQRLLNAGAEFTCFRAELVVRELAVLLVQDVDLVHDRTESLDVLFVLAAEYLVQNAKHHTPVYGRELEILRNIKRKGVAINICFSA